jgi:hypothetical protein
MRACSESGACPFDSALFKRLRRDRYANPNWRGIHIVRCELQIESSEERTGDVPVEDAGIRIERRAQWQNLRLAREAEVAVMHRTQVELDALHLLSGDLEDAFFVWSHMLQRGVRGVTADGYAVIATPFQFGSIALATDRSDMIHRGRHRRVTSLRLIGPAVRNHEVAAADSLGMHVIVGNVPRNRV